MVGRVWDDLQSLRRWLPGSYNLISDNEYAKAQTTDFTRAPLTKLLSAFYNDTFSVHWETTNVKKDQSMECAIGRASRAMALPNFKVVGPAIHLALPNFFKNCQLI